MLGRLLDDAVHGGSGSLVVRGEAGMGKTALLDYAADQAAGMTVLRVTGVEAESELAFAGLHGLARPIVENLPQLPEPQRAALGAALGLAAGDGSDRFLVAAGFLSLLAAGAEDRPILCLVDDAHWVDTPSADALIFTARRLVAESVAIVFGAREGELRRFDAPGLDQLVVGGLDRESASALLDRGSRRIAPAVRERLLAEAAGNPLALLELPARLSDAQLAGREPLPEALPLNASLRRAFMQRIERLPEVTTAALLLAAAEDGGDLRVIFGAADALGLPPDALDAAEDASLVEQDGVTLSFRHPLIRSAIYESAPLGRRQRAHDALAASLEREQQADRAVWHRAMATVSPDEAIATALEASAQRSQRRGGQASAATAFERAARLSGSERARGLRLGLAAEAAWTAGEADRARALIKGSLALADRADRGRLLYASGVIEGQSGWLGDGIATLQQAAAESTDASLTLQILRDACGMAIYAGEYEQARALGRHAAELPCSSVADRFNRAAVTGYCAELSGDYERGAALSEEAIELAERLDDPGPLVWAAGARVWTAGSLVWMAHTAARVRGPADGLRYASRAVEIARERALVVLPLALEAQAAALIGQSRFDVAYSSAEEGWRLALDTGAPWVASRNLAHLALIDALRGAESSTLARVADLRSFVAASGAKTVTRYAERALGLLDLGLGRPGEALDHLFALISGAGPESDPLFMLCLPDAVEAAARADRLDEVAAHLERFENWVQRFPSPARLALLERSRALVAGDDAEQHFARSVGLADAVSPFDRGRGQLLYGEWLRRQRRRVEARPHLRAALELFQPLAVSPWETRAASELRASGETARKRDPSATDQLTPRELQIARLAAEGMSNPDIAAQLFLSTRTIDYHLRKVFSKLEIASRTDLSGLDLGEPVAA